MTNHTSGFPKILLLITSFISLNAYSQKTDKSLEYYNAGNTAVQNKQYALADSLFTLSLNLKRPLTLIITGQ